MLKLASLVITIYQVLVSSVSCDSVTVNVDVETSKFLHKTSDKFLSVAVDTSLIFYRWEGLDFRSRKLQTLTTALAPAYWRIGGTPADACIFNSSTDQHEHLHLPSFPYPNFYFSETDWDEMNKLAMTSGWRLLFDLNSLLRHKDGSWDASNAIQILTYSIKKGYNWNLDFEIGNEPDVYPRKQLLNGTQLGKDFLLLHNILKQSAECSPYYKNAILVGPDAGDVRSSRIFNDFLKTVGDNVHAATFHHYYGNGKGAKLSHFTDPVTLDSLRKYLSEGIHKVRESGSPRLRVWLGETSSGSGGGTPNVSDRFAAGFMWLDKLGISAQMGIDVVIRQVLYGYKYHYNPIKSMDYALLDRHMDPNPDYWTSYIFKQLVGERVLKVNVRPAQQNMANLVRLYGHCAKHISKVFTVYGMNIGNSTAILHFPNELTDVRADVYLLTSYGPEGLTSRSMTLNGEELKLVDDVTLPTLKPVSYVINKQTITLPAKSLVFIVIHKPVHACM